MNKSFIRTISFAVAFVALSCCRAYATVDGSNEVILDGVAAYVNGEAITVGEVMSLARAGIATDKSKKPLTMPSLRDAYEKTLNQLISQKLIVQEYNAGEARIPNWAVEKRIAEIIDTAFGGDRSVLLQELSRQRTTFEEWRENLEEQMIVGAMRHSMVEANINISPLKILEYYNAHRSDFISSAEIKLGLIKFMPRDGESEASLKKRAATAAEWLKKGESFEGISKSFSDDPSAPNGGDWGWIVPSDILREELVAALKDLPVGGCTGVIETPAGIYILKKCDIRGDESLDFKRAAADITKILEQAERRKIMDDWVEDLRRKATIVINDIDRSAE